MIDPTHDVWVWGAGALFLLLMGARAFAVETARVRLGRTPALARMLTAGSALVLVVLCGLLAMQGGTLLFSSIVHRTDPSKIPNVVLDPNQPADSGNDAPAPGPPAAPPPGAPAPAGGT